MKRIGLIADTHSFLDEQVFRHFENCEEIWHAGDFGDPGVADALKNFRPLKGVYGNIDSPVIQREYPERLSWKCEDLTVLMIHIGGYPGRYAPGVKAELQTRKPDLFISGHSHLLKVIFDSAFNCLHMNPGAAGKQGWHKMRTIIRFVVDGKDMRDCEVIELGKR